MWPPSQMVDARVTALSARLSGLDRLSNNHAENTPSSSTNGADQHASTRSPERSYDRDVTYAPTDLVTTDGFGPFFTEPVKYPPTRPAYPDAMHSIFDHGAAKRPSPEETRAARYGETRSYYTQVPRHFLTDPNLEGDRWTQVAQARHPANEEVRRVRPINLAQQDARPEGEPNKENQPSAIETQKEWQQRYRDNGAVGEEQHDEAQQALHLRELESKLREEYAAKMAEEDYITKRMVGMGVKPDLIRQRRDPFDPYLSLSLLRQTTGRNVLMQACRAPLRHSQSSVYADPRFVQPNRHSYPPIPMFAPSERSTPTVPRQKEEGDFAVDKAIHLFLPLDDQHRCFAVPPNTLAPGRRMTANRQLVYTEEEVRSMEAMITEMQECLQRQKSLLYAKEKPTLKVDSETIKAQLKASEGEEGKPRSLETLLQQANAGQPIATRRKVKPTFVGPREAVAKAIQDVQNAAMANGTLANDLLKSGATTPSYSFASPRSGYYTAPPQQGAATPTLPKAEAPKEIAPRASPEPTQPEALPSQEELLDKIKTICATAPAPKTVKKPVEKKDTKKVEAEEEEDDVIITIDTSTHHPKSASSSAVSSVPSTPLSASSSMMASSLPSSLTAAALGSLNATAQAFTPRAWANGPPPSLRPPPKADAPSTVTKAPATKTEGKSLAKKPTTPLKAAEEKKKKKKQVTLQVPAPAKSSAAPPKKEEKPVAPQKEEKQVAPKKGEVAAKKEEKAVPSSSDNKENELELARRLSQREKQLSYGYNTEEYKMYVAIIPKNARRPKDPVSPDPKQDISKRNWDGQVKAWRRALHAWQPPTSSAATKEKQEDVVGLGLSKAAPKKQPKGVATDSINVKAVEPMLPLKREKLSQSVQPLAELREESEEELEEGEIYQPPAIAA